MAPHDRDRLDTALDSLEDQGFPGLEVIVCGRGGAEGLARLLRERDLEARCLEVEDDNFCRARNAAADEADGDLLLFMRASSVLPRSDTLERIVHKFRSYDVHGASFRLIDASKEECEWYRWDGPGDRVGGRESPVLHPSVAAVRPEMYERTEGFWEPYNRVLAYKDLAARIHMTDESVRYFPDITVQDIDARRPFRNQVEGFTYRVRNHLLFGVRTFSFPAALIWGIRGLVSNFVDSFGVPGGLVAWLRGLVSAWQRIPSAWSSRRVPSQDQKDRILGNFNGENS